MLKNKKIHGVEAIKDAKVIAVSRTSTIGIIPNTTIKEEHRVAKNQLIGDKWKAPKLRHKEMVCKTFELGLLLRKTSKTQKKALLTLFLKCK